MMANRRKSSSKNASLITRVAKWHPSPYMKPFQNRDKTYYRVMAGWDIEGRPVRPSFSVKKDAEATLNKIKNRMIAGDIKSTESVLEVAKDHEIKAAQLRLQHFGVTLPQAVDWYIHHHRPSNGTLTVEEAFDVWLKKAEREGLSEAYINAMKEAYIGPFVKHFKDRRLIDLNQDDFEYWLFEIKTRVKNSQKKEHLNKLGSFLGKCRKLGIYPDGLNPLKNIETGKDPRNDEYEVEKILSPDVVQSLLDFGLQSNKAKDWPIGIMAVLRLYCGVRRDECLRLRWGALREDNMINLRAVITKKGYRRTTPISLNAQAWIKALGKKIPAESRDPKERIFTSFRPKSDDLTVNGLRLRWADFRKRWEAWTITNNRPFQSVAQNALRDTFASYGLIVLGLETTCKAMGEKNTHSFFKFYQNFAEENHAKRFFKIVPPGHRNIQDASEDDPVHLQILSSREEIIAANNLPHDWTGDAFMIPGTNTTYRVW